jgi:hypothetical protein
LLIAQAASTSSDQSVPSRKPEGLGCPQCLLSLCYELRQGALLAGQVLTRPGHAWHAWTDLADRDDGQIAAGTAGRHPFPEQLAGSGIVRLKECLQAETVQCPGGSGIGAELPGEPQALGFNLPGRLEVTLLERQPANADSAFARARLRGTA